MPVAVEALLDLVLYTLLFLALAMCFLGKKLTDALFGPLISLLNFLHIPGLAGLVQSIDQSIVNALGSAEAKIDTAIAASWHWQARLMDQLWDSLKKHAAAILGVAQLSHRLAHVYHALRAQIHSVAHGVSGVLPRVKSLEKEYHGIEHRVKTLEREIAQGIGHDLRIQVQGLEKDLTRVENKVIPGLRSIANEAETEAERALAEVESIPFPASAKTWAEAIAVALPALGLEWLRCNSNPFKGNKQACGLWGDLAGLLGLVTTVLIAEDFEALVREMQALEGDAIGVAQDLFGVG